MLLAGRVEHPASSNGGIDQRENVSYDVDMDMYPREPDTGCMTVLAILRAAAQA